MKMLEAANLVIHFSVKDKFFHVSIVKAKQKFSLNDNFALMP